MNPLFERELFEFRHNSPGPSDVEEMLQAVGCKSLDELIRQTVPESIRISKPMDLPDPLSEHHFIKEFRAIASRNNVFRNFIGTGYYETVTPPVIQRNILENPGWYTSYTPYQAEISQGRLEALINFQTMVIDLTGMEIANASLLDEATAAAEAMTMLRDTRKGTRREGSRFFVSSNCYPQTIDVLRTRAEPLGIELVVDEPSRLDVSDETLFGILLQYPDNDGAVRDIGPLIAAASENGIGTAVAADLLSLALFTPPGEMGADVVVGTTQRFGIPLGFGGPHAAFFATRDAFKRKVPGRIIGVSVDKEGRPAYRMALQTREQHIRREKATSNICTSQVLLAVMAGAYAVYHGPDGLRRIASRIHSLARLADLGFREMGLRQANDRYFDTLKVLLDTPEEQERVRVEAEKRSINLRYFPEPAVGVSFDQAKEPEDVAEILAVFASACGKTAPDTARLQNEVALYLPDSLKRTSRYLSHPVFNSYHSEHEMLRYLKRLENRDLSLTHSMISLGSCTMKLNATTEMLPVSWPELSDIHPFAPQDQTRGYRQLIRELSGWLCEITGFQAVSMQPNSGAQGEFAGLLTIRGYHQTRGEGHRDVAIIPSSAHGTNPASAVMAGMQVVITKCDDQGNIDLSDLREKVEQHKDRLAALMVTYPSTHGVFEEDIREVCDLIHAHGGQVYLDGANMNAQVGLTSPAKIGADVCHLNLHKTFCIPHGGGGPGVGPIGVAEHLVPHLPGHIALPESNGAVASAPFGSPLILAISYAYIRMMGAEGLTNATRLAILNANYIKERLKDHYKPLYVGRNGRVGHEMIIEFRDFKSSTGIDAIDVAKRLMDYGYHAPTVSFPVAGTMMIEPTESENKAELDRFCDAMISIRKEIASIAKGSLDKEDNPLRNAPHTASMVTADHWDHSYSRREAAYPLEWIGQNKFWVSVTRIDDVYGDRNLVCSCPDTSEYA
ncbi:aminomethyl-transferring glycine dehydrogenase [Balneolales bacterium ANBcel1]|nr:aminomethyl-transferring glycine dehydrogenase [Balneolales bacterium ANBcel1]